jgi:hypothetical protein
MPATSLAHIVESRHAPPSALRFMARAFLPSRGLREGAAPTIVQRWSRAPLGGARLSAFARATGLASGDAPILYPHVLGFRLHMAVLTHPAFPLPIWNALQIRNRFVAHARLDPDALYTLETRSGAWRNVEKGVEIDLTTRLTRGEGVDWESVVTFFYRGRPRGPIEPAPTSPDLADAEPLARFRAPRGGGRAFGGLTGDYNGIHLWGTYARRFGFRAAFLHPARATGLCLARLPAPSPATTLDVWIKGPVYYGAEAKLVAARDAAGCRFGLCLDGDDRPAIAGAIGYAGPRAAT